MIEYSPDERLAKERSESMKQRYRNVFSSPEGISVLGHILKENHFGVPLNNEVERIEYNVAVAIARMSGMMSQIDVLMKIGED